MFSCFVNLDAEGGIVFNTLDSGGNLVTVPGQVWVSLGLFNEDRPNWLSYEHDSDLAAEVCRAKLELEGYEAMDREHFNKAIRTLCSPGPGHPAQWVNLTKLF